jgi:glutaredoxin 3
MTNNQKAKVVMYSKVPCPYCVAAENFFNDKEIVFQKIDLTDRPEEIDRIKQETGWRTVPIIMINDKLIGGYTDVKTLDESGELEKLLF